MTTTSGELHTVDVQQLAQYTDFRDALESLPGASIARIEGQDRQRTRAIVTLLHANEPSGFKALHRLIRERIQPRTNIAVVVASVTAAQAPPLLSRRHLPSEEDLNRCFAAPFDTRQRLLAESILRYLRDLQPEVVIDSHNTSSHSEPFCVAHNDSTAVRVWANTFSPRLVVLQSQLGTLLEQPIGDAPVVTVEFGSWMDPRVDDIAYDALRRLFDIDNPAVAVRDQRPTRQITLHRPRRLLVDKPLKLHYRAGMADQDESEQLTLINSIDQCNFKMLAPGTTLGWCSSPRLPIRLDHAAESATDYLTVKDSVITTSVPLMLFMATTDATIAMEDCIAYLVPDRDIEHR